MNIATKFSELAESPVLKTGRSMVGRKRLGQLACMGLILGSVAFAPAAGAATLKDILSSADKWLAEQMGSQKKVDKLTDDQQDKAAQYRDALREADSIRMYNKLLQKQLDAQQAEMASIRDEERSIETTNLKIQPLMLDMLAVLKQFVSLDVPFMMDVRNNRIQTLDEMMPRADVTVSEKFRRIVEAYQTEIDYGRTVGAYAGKVGNKDVEFLRVGRVALLYQTPDKSETGYWDKEKKDWVVDNDVADQVDEAIRVAKGDSSPDLFTIPVMAATAAGEQ
jgi:hypothetical protein